MRLRDLFAVALLACAFDAFEVSAEETAQFLEVGVGARAVSMGGAFTALADDPEALAWNPAGLASARRELSATHADLTGGARYEFLGIAQPTRFGTLGAAGGYLMHGSLDGRDASGKPTGSFSAADSVVTLGLGAKAGGLRLGGALKSVESRIAGYSASGYAADFGAQTELGLRGPGVASVGAALQNVGPGMRFLDQTEPLPLTAALGFAYRLPLGVTLAADFKERVHGRSSEIDVGTEYALFSSFSLRAGYASSRATPAAPGTSAAPLSGLGAGFGVRSHGYSLDYSMSPFGALGNVQRFSLGARF